MEEEKDMHLQKAVRLAYCHDASDFLSPLNTHDAKTVPILQLALHSLTLAV